jgi:hypothetical protein
MIRYYTPNRGKVKGGWANFARNPIIPLMDAYRLRLAQLALENMPFPLHQTRTVLDLHAADGATTLYLQYFMPYSTVFGLTTGSPSRDLAACGQRYLATLPNGFQCDCVVAIVEPSQPIEPTLRE